MSSRYFANPYHDSGKYELSTRSTKSRILSIVDQIVENFQPSVKHGEKGVYTGTAGVAYAFYCLAKSGLFMEHNEKFLHLAESYIQVALEASNLRSRRSIGLMSGNSGVYLIAALISAMKRDRQTSQKYADEYRSLAKLCEPLDFLKDGSDEIFVGRAGYLFGILLLQRDLHTEVVSKRRIHALCNAVIESGKKLRSQVDMSGSLPLLYEYHGKAYLGAAHGFAGILQALLSFPAYLREEPNAPELVRQSVDFLLDLCHRNRNIATNLDGALSGQGKYLVHWCHGAAGIVYTFARAYLVFGKDKKYLNACRMLADTVWEKGLLKKGPGICHGVAGSGYVFLLMYRLTGEEIYLYRAERFGAFMFTEVFSEGARTPDCPFSLFEGLAGTICFLNDLLQPRKAEFPFSDVFFESS